MRYGPVEPIDRHHLTDEFDCGSDAQTQWLRRYALQAHRMDTSRVQVVTRINDPRVVGYYALAAGSVAVVDAPTRVARGMPRYPVPVILLTRLGVDRQAQGSGLGAALLKDALMRVASAADEIAARALLIHCETDEARSFYEHLIGVEPSPTDSLHLFLLLSDLRRAIGQAVETASRSPSRAAGTQHAHE